MVLLSGCATAPAVKCPALPPPPPAVVDALEASGRSDARAAEWVVGLERHYRKLGDCMG